MRPSARSRVEAELDSENQQQQMMMMEVVRQEIEDESSNRDADSESKVPKKGEPPLPEKSANEKPEPSAEKSPSSQSTAKARVKRENKPLLSEKVASNDDEWQKILPTISLLCPLKEFQLKLNHQQKRQRKMDKEIQKSTKDTSSEKRDSVTLHLQKRKLLVNMLHDLSPDSSGWNCIAISVAKARLADLDKSIAQVEEALSDYLASGKSLGDLKKGEVTYKWLDVSSESSSNELVYDVVNVLLLVCLWYSSFAFCLSKGKIGQETLQLKSLGCQLLTPAPFGRFAGGLLRKAGALLLYAEQLCVQTNLDKVVGHESTRDYSLNALSLLHAICLSDVSCQWRLRNVFPANH